MDKYIDSFPVQLREAFKIGYAIPEIARNTDTAHIVFCGMGGSGIGGKFIAEFIRGIAGIPVFLNQNYDLPAFVNEKSLVICSSYSGNTEETISNLNQALERNCTIVCITSGGRMEKIITEKKLTHIKIPGGMPPRSCLGYSLVTQLFILLRSGFISSGLIQQAETSIQFLEENQNAIRNKGKEIAKKLTGKLPLLYTADGNSAMAFRWKQQINENSKLQCFCHVVPEMNHNELVAFETPLLSAIAVLLRNPDDHPRISKRFDLMKELIGQRTGSVIELWSEGNNEWERCFYFIHLGDWVSFYLAAENHADPMEIKILDDLKKRLGNI